ncbi:hypothetical protein HPB48_023113 [Haemaphysalis longicornis]|uniref:Ig-like domain-containing protein n=1 Tax=Haemaphysalis longicornis TaxID=44386 RepID=A0A9J6FYA3_HAELO|nr:hypothetical protein HPB48_023113 [Haemaphysalis longicornis]
MFLGHTTRVPPSYLYVKLKEAILHPMCLWFKDDDILDSSFTVLRAQRRCAQRATVGSAPPARPTVGSPLQCFQQQPLRATNGATNARPELAGLVAGEVAEARCVARGARPLAQVAWFKGGQRLQHERMVSREAGSTLSAASFVVRAQDHGAQLTCRADNPSLPGSEISDTVQLNVQCE